MPEYVRLTFPGVGKAGIGVGQPSCLAASSVLTVRVADGFALDGGRWELAKTKDQQPVARIAPPATPMFQQVVELRLQRL